VSSSSTPLPRRSAGAITFFLAEEAFAPFPPPVPGATSDPDDRASDGEAEEEGSAKLSSFARRCCCCKCECSCPHPRTGREEPRDVVVVGVRWPGVEAGDSDAEVLVELEFPAQARMLLRLPLLPAPPPPPPPPPGLLRSVAAAAAALQLPGRGLNTGKESEREKCGELAPAAGAVDDAAASAPPGEGWPEDRAASFDAEEDADADAEENGRRAPLGGGVWIACAPEGANWRCSA